MMMVTIQPIQLLPWPKEGVPFLDHTAPQQQDGQGTVAMQQSFGLLYSSSASDDYLTSSV